MAKGQGSYFGGGAGTVNITTNADATARADAAAAKAVADANKTKIDALVPPSGATVAAGSTTNFVVGGVIGPWTNANAATVPGSTTDANLRAAGFLPFTGGSSGNSQFYFATRADNSTVAPTATEAPTSAFGDTCDIKLANGSTLKYRHNGTSWVLLRTDAVAGADGNQRFFALTRASASIAVPSTAEITTMNGGVPYTLQNGDIVKVVNNRRAVVWYTHNGTSWDGGRAEPDTPNQRIFHIVRGNETATAPSQGEIDSVNGSAYALRQYDTARVYTPTRVYVYEHTGTAWGAALEEPDFSRTGVFVGQSTTFAGLPTSDAQGNTIRTGDLALLSTRDGLNPRGIYGWIGASFRLSFEIAEANQPGSYIGTATTFAALPTTLGAHTAVLGDWVWLSADDGANAAGAYVWNGTAYVRSWGVAAGGVPSINTVLATLPADAWTNVPTSVDIPDPHNVTAQDQFGNNIDIPIRRNAGAWQAQSSVTMPNVQFTLWR